MDLNLISKSFEVRKLMKEDASLVLSLCLENPMFYAYCPPFPTIESVLEDMQKLPPKKTLKDKYYLGFFKENTLIAVMDLILAYPNENTAFIGFFMVKKECQNQGIGTLIINEAFSYLSIDFKEIRLGYIKGNSQSEAFWMKQGFVKTGIIINEEAYTIIVLKKDIGGESCGN